MSLITEDHLINSYSQKLSLSLLITTVWTLWESTCGPFSSMWGQTRPADDDPCCHRLPSLNHGDLGRGRHEQIRVSPFIFNSKVSLLCAAAAGMSPPTSGGWEGVGWELAVLASINTTNLPTQSPPQIPLAPSVPISPPEPPYLTNIIDLYWGYLGRILTISLPYILGLSHFLNTFNTVPQQVHPTCTTIPKQHCEVKSIHAHFCLSTSVQLFLLPDSPIALVWLQYACHISTFSYIVILIYLPALQHFKHTENIFNE